MIVAWTGHRPNLFLDPSAAQTAVQAAADEVVHEGATRFLVGGQRGVDTWAACAAIDRGIPFVMVLPLTLDGFTRGWMPADRARLGQTLDHAADVQIAGDYTLRNQRLATDSDLLLAVWTRTGGGGTAETIEFARQAGTPVREIILEPSPQARSARGRGI